MRSSAEWTIDRHNIHTLSTHEFIQWASACCRVDYRPKVKPDVCAICSWIIFSSLPECSLNIFRIFPWSRFLTRASLFSITINFGTIDNTIIFRCVVKRGEARRRRNEALNIEKQGSAAVVIFWQTSSYCCWPFPLNVLRKKNATTFEQIHGNF